MIDLSRRQDRAIAILNELIQEKGYHPGDYALFFSTGEGIFLPNSTEEDEFEMVSGDLIDRSGRVFSWVFGWDVDREVPGLVEWNQVTPDQAWSDDPEYRSARRKVELPD